MMGGWRRQNGDNYDYKVARPRSQSRKPPIGNWQPTVPWWEKEFCKVVGQISWKKLLECKRYSYLYENVLNWNDSAGEEAFYNAKNRFWAKINRVPCELSLPDPDIYIDNVDWDAEVDHELMRDLEQDPMVVPDWVEKDQNVVILAPHLLVKETFYCTGWGEPEENFKYSNEYPWVSAADVLNNAANIESGGYCRNSWEENNNNVCENSWDVNNNVGGNSWDVNNNVGGNSWDVNNNVGGNSWDVNNNNVYGNSWGANKGHEVAVHNYWNGGYSWGWNNWGNGHYAHPGAGAANYGKNQGGGGGGGGVKYMSRYKTSRFQNKGQQQYMNVNREWCSNENGRNRVNFVYNRPW